MYAQSIVQFLFFKEKGQPIFFSPSNSFYLRFVFLNISDIFIFLFLTEAFRFLDGKRHLLHKLLVTLVRWQIQSIEAGV
jgi:hypothetical protein